MSIEQISGKCPGIESLNEVYDGECSDADIIEHAAHCPICREYIENLRKLDRELENAFDQNTPADIGERCLAKIHSNLTLKRKKVFPFSYHRLLLLTRSAAIVTILTFSAYLIWRSTALPNRTEEPQQMFVGKASPSAAVPAEIAPYGRVKVSDLASVSFLGKTDENLLAGQPEKYAAIPSSILQVWTSPLQTDASIVSGTLAKLLQGSGIPRANAVLSSNSNNVEIRFSATKKQCVAFVRSCKAAGYLLNSPGQPQPEQKKFLGSESEKVRYRAEFILHRN